MIQELNNVKNELENAENIFNFTTDSDLLDSSIYKLEALNAKYRKLLKEIKSYRNNQNKEAI